MILSEGWSQLFEPPHTISISNLLHKLTKVPAFSVQLKAYIAKALLMTDAIALPI